jgi:Flp pilus assembly protein TadG
MEFALIVPIVLMVIIGAVTSGIAYSNAIGVTNAVRESSRFGATADATQSSWVSDVLSRTRDTQFDDPGHQTAVCVQLYKQGTGTVKQGCVVGATTLTMPATNQYPAVPTGLTTGTCVVRVIAARPYTINAVVANWDRTMVRGSVARYERPTTAALSTAPGSGC